MVKALLWKDNDGRLTFSSCQLESSHGGRVGAATVGSAMEAALEDYRAIQQGIESLVTEKP